MTQANAVYLLSIQGKLAPKALEAARSIHNDTAGAPASVAAARSLGDLSHMVFVPMDHGAYTGDFLILDQWNNLEGLNQFFADPHVQEGGGLIFSQRDPVVWGPAEGFFNYHCPAPYGRNDRFVGVVRGKLPSIEVGRARHNELVGKVVNQARMAGSLSHETYLRMAAPGSPEALEFCAIDTWMDAEGMNKLYSDPAFMAGFSQMFAGAPASGVWTHPTGNWVEW